MLAKQKRTRSKGLRGLEVAAAMPRGVAYALTSSEYDTLVKGRGLRESEHRTHKLLEFVLTLGHQNSHSVFRNFMRILSAKKGTHVSI